ncbi:hypothetical protein BJX63DRAFT_289655 [Aspergillus granulosus]|uniref:Uncharacterized protein n=1 Tax=Aspergillus granulosus TaxID=176169 RepID=A0ABR4H6X6_9EURO
MVGETDEVEYLTAYDIIIDSIPDPAETDWYSSGTGLHHIDFKGKLEYWAGFQSDVRTSCLNVSGTDSLNHWQRALKEDVNFSEYFLCGTELSSSARYVTNVLNPTAGVAEKLGYNLRFSDWTAAGSMLSWPKEAIEAEKEAKDKRSIPDYALLVPSPREVRALGESKHPWSKQVERTVADARRGTGRRLEI